MKPMRIAAATVAAAGLLAAGCQAAAASTSAPTVHRGHLVSATHLSTMDVKQVRSRIGVEGFDPSPARTGVTTYRLRYETVDPRGKSTVASGLVVLPQNKKRTLRVVSYTHGTTSYRGDVPSVSTDGYTIGAPVLYGAAGFASVAPDYLGLGTNPGPPAYLDVPTETSASLDLLRATRTFADQRGITLRREVDVTGFSQGASAATGLGRALQNGADPNFALHAIAPVSGAYAFRDVELPAFLSGQVTKQLTAIYPTYLLVSYNNLHHLWNSPTEVFRPPYADRVTHLFDGSVPGPEMMKALPKTLDELLTPRGLALLYHPSGRFAAALRVLDQTCTNWRPTAPIRLYYAHGDEQAVNGNTTACHVQFAAHGVSAPTVDIGPADYQGSVHLGSNVKSAAHIARWFTGLE